MALDRRPASSKELADQVEAAAKDGPLQVEKKDIDWEGVKVVSTGSTLLDLAISGGRLYYGGIPCCILCEVYGPSQSGKTAILSEVGGSAQAQGGEIVYMDPEARLDQEYSRIYGVALDKSNYHRPDTVGQIFDIIKKWNPESDAPHVALTDSLAALTTDMELSPTGDKMGMRRAKEFSQGLRVHARKISDMLLMCSNQERDGDYGSTTPGGRAIPYYASLRIRICMKRKIELTKTFAPRSAITQEQKPDDGKKKKKEDVEISKIIGIESECIVTKSTVDDPYRSAPVYIVFGYGVDDIRGNLQYLKDMRNDTVYRCPDGKGYMGMEQAITHVEETDLARQLREQTVEIWHEAEELFRANRERKKAR